MWIHFDLRIIVRKWNEKLDRLSKKREKICEWKRPIFSHCSLRPVWQDVENKCSPNFTVSILKSSHSSFKFKRDVFQSSSKSCLGNLSGTKYQQKLSNSPNLVTLLQTFRSILETNPLSQNWLHFKTVTGWLDEFISVRDPFYESSL